MSDSQRVCCDPHYEADAGGDLGCTAIGPALLGSGSATVTGSQRPPGASDEPPYSSAARTTLCARYGHVRSSLRSPKFRRAWAQSGPRCIHARLCALSMRSNAEAQQKVFHLTWQPSASRSNECPPSKSACPHLSPTSTTSIAIFRSTPLRITVS